MVCKYVVCKYVVCKYVVCKYVYILRREGKGKGRERVSGFQKIYDKSLVSFCEQYHQ